MTLYLDDELEVSDCSPIEAHLNRCADCSAAFQSERRFLDLIRAFRIRRVASPELRAQVENILNAPSLLPLAPPELRQRVKKLLRQRPLVPAGATVPLIPRWALPVAAILVVALGAAWWSFHDRGATVRSAPTSDFAEMAADTHLRHIRGQLPLEIISDAPAQLSAWFTNKVPFLVKLPNYQESSGQEKLYRLEGARLVSYKNDYAAYVAYQMRSRPISLVVTSDTVAQASGGDEIVAKEITFHYNSIQGLKVITWSDRGLTYALVSNLEERGQESCIVCHQGTKDRDFIERLKPK